MPGKMICPTFREENALYDRGLTLIAGVDEAGRGALAGPVVAGAVILARRRRCGWLKDIRDSKMLTAEAREELYRAITSEAVSFGAGIVSHIYIDENGIAPATKLAMKLAIEAMSSKPQALLIDYLTLPSFNLPQKGITDGDALCVSIACASIIAKVTRDRLMQRLDTEHCGYGLGQHKGYCTPEHIQRLNKLGPSPIHRYTFDPVNSFRSLL
ncbi:RNase HII [Dehalogenimonas formicexedens]|uniref:Ribonuclease HII n=1 Tax=Dehalogenimonas formicexedens TaxID=1839801 RepID=A0A1P8F796_9CHLR|nr:ribonuclease HII [Dehalogenimonas formicexedens]APV44328.1 RNase HII [Dehalogenimonas formicexedens]